MPAFRTSPAVVLFLLASWFVAVPVAAEEPLKKVNYLSQIKPLLMARCYACHGALKQESGLRLDTAALMLRGGDGGAAVLAGKSGESPLIVRVSDSDPKTRMPPEGEGGALSAAEINLLRAWIDQGATGPADEKPEEDPREHWSFRSPQRQPIPAVKDAAWSKTAVDRFIAELRDQNGLVPQSLADKRTWLRRVYLDLVGLPPTIDEQEAFIADSGVDSYDRVIDRLLASPSHGERWGRHWMDVWRYSDWWGLGAEVRNSQKHIWHWRDWIVESLNAGVGYDEMLRQMLAADELYPDDLQRLRATGFLARNYFKFNRNTWLEGTVEHTFKAFMGMTINCSRCHDHKYDPISQTDYYRLRAFFEPHQIRTEQLPGEADYEKNGIPRVFDCNLEAPTYRFVRGDEKNPVTDQPLSPGVPGLLSFDELKIEPVSLPATAAQPGLRPWVLGNHLANAQRQVEAARQALEKARNVHAAAMLAANSTSSSLDKSKSNPDIDSLDKSKTQKSDIDELTALAEKKDAGAASVVKDDFVTAKPELWEPLSGLWRYDGTRAVQFQDVMARTTLRLKKTPPPDFQATFKFAILGGQTYKSVGLAFDVEEGHEVFVYLSAYASDPKLQIAYKRGGAMVYPTEAKSQRPVKLGDAWEMTVRVRGSLINVELNGQHALAWNSPVPRRPGKIELVTFDAVAGYTGFELSPLSTKVKLADAKSSTAVGPSSKPPSPEIAAAEVKLAELVLATAELQAPVANARAAADHAKAEKIAAEKIVDLARAAALLEKRLATATAKENVVRAELAVLKSEPAKKADAEKKFAAAQEAAKKAEVAEASPGETYVSLSGALKTLESSVETDDQRRRPFPITSTGRRTALARWITDRRHPLTARVAVNHIWLRHFGKPFVANVFEFGRKGTPPTHPALMDWLANELMDSDWDMKHVHRLMVGSRLYQTSSSTAAFSQDGADKRMSVDSENRFYWRMNPIRMEAQMVRDAMLKLSGDLEAKMSGPSLDPVIQEMSRRRSLYFVHSHNDHHKFLSIFDDANVLECYRREQSIVPQQALALSNSKQAFEAATKIADKIAAELNDPSDVSLIRAAFVTVLAAEPTADELAACQEALVAWKDVLKAEKGSDPLRQSRINLIHALLNHNDFVTVR